MSRRTDDFAARDRDDVASRLARRLDREMRRRAERRRAAILISSFALAGVLLLAGGITVVAATRGDRPGGASPRVSVGTVTPGSAATSSASDPVTETAESDALVSAPEEVEEPTPAEPKASKDDDTTSKSSTQPKKTSSSRTSGSALLVRKCSGSGCHTSSQVKGVELDEESAVGTVDGMIDGGYVDLTKEERRAVIDALTGN